MTLSYSSSQQHASIILFLYIFLIHSNVVDGAKDNMVYYMSKLSKTKNTIIIGRHLKYLIFIHPSLHLSKGYYNMLYRERKLESLKLNRKNKLGKILI
jgi:hypothetical protein